MSGPLVRRRDRRRDLVARLAVNLLERAVEAAQQLTAVATRPPAPTSPELGNGIVVTEVVTHPSCETTRPQSPVAVEPPPPLAWRLCASMSQNFDTVIADLTTAQPLHDDETRAARVRKIRISTRRLRAFVDLTSPELSNKPARRTGNELRDIGKTLGTLRQWDSYFDALQHLHQTASDDSERAAIEYIFDWTERQRARALRRTQAQMQNVRVEKVAAKLGTMRDTVIASTIRQHEQTESMIATWLAPQIARGLDGCENWPTLTDPVALHDARIQIKRLRYTLKWCAPAIGKQGRRFRKELRQWQRILGDHHDSFLAWELVQRRRAKLEQASRPILTAALDRVCQRLETQQRTALERLRARAEKTDLRHNARRLLDELAPNRSAAGGSETPIGPKASRTATPDHATPVAPPTADSQLRAANETPPSGPVMVSPPS